MTTLPFLFIAYGNPQSNVPATVVDKWAKFGGTWNNDLIAETSGRLVMILEISSNLLTHQMLFAKTDLAQDAILWDESFPENLGFQNISRLCIFMMVKGSWEDNLSGQDQFRKQ